MSTTSTKPAFIDPLELLSDDQTAEQLNIKSQTLASWRADGRGPPYVKIGRAVFYHPKDVATWLGKQRHDPAPAQAGAPRR